AWRRLASLRSWHKFTCLTGNGPATLECARPTVCKSCRRSSDRYVGSDVKSTVHYFGRLFLIDQLPAGKIAVYVFLEMIALGFALEAVAAFFSFRFALMFSTKHFGQKPT